MDDVENNESKLPELPVNEEENLDDDDDENTSSETITPDEHMGQGLGELDDRIFDFDDDNYDWGNVDEVNEMLEQIQNKPTLISKFDLLLEDIKKEKDLEKKERKIKGYKSILRDTVDKLKIRDRLNEEAWGEERLNLEEREKFLWEQKINNVNSALKEEGVRLDPFNKELFNYLKTNLTETFTEKDEGREDVRNINGYKYGDKKILQRNRDRKTFRGIDNKEFNNFLERMKKFTATSARSELIDILGDDQNIEVTARECISELRDAEKSIIRRSNNVENLTDARAEVGDIEENIDNLKNNKKFNLGRGVVERTLQGRIAKFKGWVKENETTLGVGATSLILSIVSGLATSIPLIEKLKDAANGAKKIGKGIEKFGRKISQMGNQMDSVLKDPVKAAGAIVGLSGKLFDDVMNFAFPILVVIILAVIIYIINKWIGVF